MNKIKQNKVTFTLILSFLAIIFSSLIILSLPVLFNYKSKVTQIEKNFYKNFKFYLNSNGKISYKPFPKPHLLVENATLSLSSTSNRDKLIKTTNLKIYISLRNIYLRSFKNLISTEISDSNLELKIEDINGCVDSTTKLIKVIDEHTLYVPNAFTPDLDGKNDVFTIYHHGLREETWRFEVYDRFGSLIYSSENPNESWDGTNKFSNVEGHTTDYA